MDPILWTPWRMPYLRGEDSRQHDGCILCGKVHTEDDAAEFVVARTEHMVVALNLYPYNNGHLLIIPRQHVPSIEALPVEALTDLMVTVNKGIAALRALYKPHAFNIGANIGSEAGAGIPEHFHLHVVPRWNADSNFMMVTAGTRVVPDVLENTFRELREVWPE